MKRKDFLLKTGAACVGLSILPTMSCSNSSKKDKTQNTPFVLPELGFAYDSLEPAIDARTMEIHYTKHHAGYVKKLNTALENHDLKGYDLETICRKITSKDKDVAVLNNAGGHYNHSLFWEILKPKGAATPKGELLSKIEAAFGSFESFSEQFMKAAATLFGSGWAWLIVDNAGKLAITTTQNQENPLMQNVVEQTGMPILGLDVWEHAYYLHYQNKRADYIKNFMTLINWDVVAEKYHNIKL